MQSAEGRRDIPAEGGSNSEKRAHRGIFRFGGVLTLFSCRSNYRRSALSEPHFRLLSPFSGLPGSFLSSLFSEGKHVFLLSPCPVSRLISSRFFSQKMMNIMSFSFLLSGLPALSYLLASLYTRSGKKELMKKESFFNFFRSRFPSAFTARNTPPHTKKNIS